MYGAESRPGKVYGVGPITDPGQQLPFPSMCPPFSEQAPTFPCHPPSQLCFALKVYPAADFHLTVAAPGTAFFLELGNSYYQYPFPDFI